MTRDSSAGVLTVSQLLRQVNVDLGARYSSVAVEGEVTNFTRSGAGHCYFTIKDKEAQLKVVLFASAARRVKFDIENGLAVVVRGKLTIYAQRGSFQLAADHVEPVGIGALQLAFEQLKERLAHEGLFAEERKRPLPRLPSRIAVVTSAQGAALRDILNVLRRRFDGLHVQIYSVRVQGREAAREIEQAIRDLTRWNLHDVILLSRGGGSLEDLWPFNEEIVARALADTTIPVISGVGHEVDFTIADFVADVRAPTPSAAAEIVVEAKESLALAIDHQRQRIERHVDRRVSELRHRIQTISSAEGLRAFPEKVRRRVSRLSEGRTKMYTVLEKIARDVRERLDRTEGTIRAFPARLAIEGKREQVRHHATRAERAIRTRLSSQTEEVRALVSTLEAVSPLSILARGYAVAYRFEKKKRKIVRSPNEVELGENIQVQLSGGSLGCEVRDKTLGVEAVTPEAEEKTGPVRRFRARRRKGGQKKNDQFGLPLGE